jgi:hypothetical protein
MTVVWVKGAPIVSWPARRRVESHHAAVVFYSAKATTQRIFVDLGFS